MVTKVTRSQVFADGWGLAAQIMTLRQSVAPHTHDFVELVLVLEGSLTHVWQGASTPVSGGDVLCVRPGSWHALEAPQAAVVANVYIGQELLVTDFSWLVSQGPTSLLLSGGTGRIIDRDSTWEMVGRLAACTGGRLERTGWLACVLAGLEGAREERLGWEQRLSALMAEVTHDLAADWSVVVLAEKLHLSTSHFRRVFTTVVGRSPGDWLSESRAEAMAVTLVSTDVPVHLAAQRVGWPDPNYASRRFRQLRGMTPSQYRQRYRFER